MTQADQGMTVNAIMSLIDDYAEVRHKAGHWTYNDKAREARGAVQKALMGCEEPLFWVRLCSSGGYEGPLHKDRIEAVRKLSGAWSPLYLGATPAPEEVDESLQDLQEQLHEAQTSLAFYKSRCEQLQKAQNRMRDPERTVVCDILANGHLLLGSDGQLDADRYKHATILVDPERREAARRDESLADIWRNRVSGFVEEFTTDEQARYIADRIVSSLYDLPPRGIARPDEKPEKHDDPLRALIAQHAALLEQNEYAYFELCYHRTTGWMAWITDKPMCMPPVVNADRKVLAQGQGGTPDEACSDAAGARQGK